MYMTILSGKQADIRGEENPALAEFSTVQQAIFMEDFAIFFSPLTFRSLMIYIYIYVVPHR